VTKGFNAIKFHTKINIKKEH